jgi:hypothetical protein
VHRHRQAAPWVTRQARSRAPDRAPILVSRRRPAQTRFRHSYGYRRGPSRLTLGAAAATAAAVAAVAGVSAAVSAGATSAVSAPSGRVGHPGASLSAASSAAVPSRRAVPHKVPAHQPARPLAAPTSSERSRQQAAGRRQAAARQAATPATDAQPYLIYDSATPSAIPPNYEIATYADGPHPVSASEVAGRGPVLWIDINGTDPAASVLDVEPGCATPSVAANWVWRRLTAEPDGVAIIYTMLSEWPAVQAAVGTLPAQMLSHIRWWIADPTGVPHVVPGSNATQWYWGPNYDISTAEPGF